MLRFELFWKRVKFRPSVWAIEKDFKDWQNYFFYSTLAAPEARSPILPDKYLYSEPGIADTLNEEERIVSIGAVLVQGPGSEVPPRPDGDVPDHRDPHVRVSLQAEGQNGDTDEEDRDYTDKLK